MIKKVVAIFVCMLLFATILSVTVSANHRPDPPVITGPSAGSIDTRYDYQITVTDPDEDYLTRMEVDFGDGTTEYCGTCGTKWESGTIVYVYHTWQDPGTYEVTARVKDLHHAWSNWSDPQIITLPKVKPVIHPLLLQFLERFFEHFPLITRLLNQGIGLLR